MSRLSNEETALQAEIMLETSKLGIVLLRNNSGSLPNPRTGRWVRFGVGGKGGSDLIGWNTEGKFCAVEVKTDKGEARKEQRDFITAVRSSGGYAGIARSVEDAIAICRGEVKD